ncbi:polymorphic toxin type 44 domain-containing protein [Ureibacillus sp. MALMAid1270]|uniref:polymorphic toxin type 44 domain-containing protein n=1 Tax=Ureibacillus sp. MALMAid1270 TaxID=3411629 RepID=UPI003BA47B71
MRKILTSLLLLVAFSLFGATHDAFANTNDSSKESLIENDEIFKKAVDLGLVNLESNGEIIYLGDEKSLEISSESYTEFLEKIESSNFLVGLKVAKVDNEYNIILLSSEEIADVIYENDKKSKSNVNLDSSVTPFGIDPGLPTINLKSLVESNKRELEDFYSAVLKTSPQTAYYAAVGYFVGKVREGGEWDYKIQPGYRYWYKEWTAYTYSGTRIINTEYIGNYNYAYVGESLFSKNTLLIGGASVGAGVGQPEDDNDRQAIIEGFDDAVRYW